MSATAMKHMLPDPVALSHALIRHASVTPDDAGCQALIAKQLQPLGCEVHWLHAGAVSNLWIRHGAQPAFRQAGHSPHLMFLGHTDVVPPGDMAGWDDDPFIPREQGGYLYGRGAADMKAAVAAMVAAMARYIHAHPDHPGTVSLLLTSDEEGPADDGVRKAAPWLQAAGALPDYCLVGEPSCREVLGDTVRIGRRGSIHGRWQWRGVQGHTAYTQPAENPLHRALAGMAAVTQQTFDNGSDAFPPTCLNLVKVLSDSGANNITPSRVAAAFNIRNNPLSPAAQLYEQLQAILKSAGAVPDHFEWKVSGEPFMTAGDAFRRAVCETVAQHTGVTPDANTGGGTSDGRFLAPLGVQVVEFGLLNTTIHQVNECTPVADIRTLATIYQELCQRMLNPVT